jgi:hypothetical protein
MNVFEAMLDELSGRDADAPATCRVAAGVRAGLDGSPIAAAAPSVVAARYAEEAAQSDQPASPTPPSVLSPMEWGRLLDEAERAGASVARLRGLRRELAWACHPDRAGDDPDRAMTGVNARIDAMIARARR